MIYDKYKIYKRAIEIITKKKLFFIEHLVANLPVAKSTFYEYFPIGSDESNTIKDLLDKNRIDVSTAQLKKWFDSENATLQVSLMKIIGTDEIKKALSMNYNNIEHSGEIKTNTDLSKLTTSELIERAKALQLLENKDNESSL